MYDDGWQLAMLVVVGDERLALAREVGQSQADVACLKRIVAAFIDRECSLRQGGGRLASEGYTKHCLELWADGVPVLTVTGAHRAHGKVLRRPAFQAWEGTRQR